MTNSIRKSVFGYGVAAVVALSMLLGVAATASASVDFDPIAPVVFDNGNGWESSIDGSAGNTFRTRVVFDVTSDSDVNAVSYDRVGDFVGLECVQFNEVTQTVSNFAVEFDQRFPTPVGQHDFVYKLYGVDGAGQDFNCTSANEVDSITSYDQITTNLGSSNTSGNSGGGNSTGNTNSEINQLTNLVANLASQVSCFVSGGTWTGSSCTPKPVTPPAPVGNSACTEYAALSAGLYQGSDTRQGGRVGQLQSFLMYKGFNIPLLSSNQAPYGYYGSQTNSAAIQFVAANHCN